ncbi:glucosamine-6-phosphate deaminase [Leucobacter sp. CSA1]|uniref:Glucosamine-6-phosphate deaminase n=1 Tax=Leucobacter chromiisoli TaxID=2796471 RepID=A0A934Q998_9MICO|nr:glucosamine-6-phosphate deaminase [Leucobacter chromiisoli]MBK0419491.1 glucosamine-6-phosphate deaminase [Leucobacter chromiisoli]
MKIVIVPDAEAVGRYAAERIAATIRSAAGRPAPSAVSGASGASTADRSAASGGREATGAVLGVATGSSPLGTYAELARRVRAGEIDTAGVSAFALDEYLGLDPTHPESYHSVIRRSVTEPLGLDPRRVHVPDGAAADIRAACLDYERRIREAGGIDLQLLGIGANGHIGFNEPTSSFASRTRLKTLAPRTRIDNARFFGSLDEVPLHCVTQGLGTILEARQLLLVAHGEAKADAVARMVEGPLAAVCPASALQLHPDATVVIDRAASSLLRLTDYYEHVQRNLPEHAGTGAAP